MQMKNIEHLDHVAIMKKEWGLIPKILSGEKKLESRWYMNKCRPWDHISRGDTVYFKNAGEPVTLKAKVSGVVQESDLNPIKVRELLWKYAQDDGLGIDDDKLEIFYERFKDKKYVMFIYLAEPQEVKPFEINKKGFGAMSAWISIDCVEKLKVKSEKDWKNY